MEYSAQGKNLRQQAKEILIQRKHQVQDYPRIKQTCICLGVTLFFLVVMLWFKHGFEALGDEKEVYTLQRDLKEHFKNFTIQYNKVYDDDEYQKREKTYMRNYLLTRHQAGSSLMSLNHMADWYDAEYEEILGLMHKPDPDYHPKVPDRREDD